MTYTAFPAHRRVIALGTPFFAKGYRTHRTSARDVSISGFRGSVPSLCIPLNFIRRLSYTVLRPLESNFILGARLIVGHVMGFGNTCRLRVFSVLAHAEGLIIT